MEYNRANDWPDLPYQTRLFALEYSVAGNFFDACKKIDITKAKGSQLLRNPIVRGFLDDLFQHDRDDAIITRDFVELQMLETLEQVNGDVDVPSVTRDGEVVMGRHFNGQAKIALLKEMKQFAGVRDAKAGGVTINFNFDDLGVKEKEVGVTIEHE